MLAFANCVTASVAHFIPFEMGNSVETLSRLGSVAAVWFGTVIAVLWMETVVYVAAETFSAMKPWANANESAASEPFPAVVAVGGAFVGRGVIVAVGTLGRHSEFDAYLSALGKAAAKHIPATAANAKNLNLFICSHLWALERNIVGRSSALGCSA
jgi:hypothetical protein